MRSLVGGAEIGNQLLVMPGVRTVDCFLHIYSLVSGMGRIAGYITY